MGKRRGALRKTKSKKCPLGKDGPKAFFYKGLLRKSSRRRGTPAEPEGSPGSLHSSTNVLTGARG